MTKLSKCMPLLNLLRTGKENFKIDQWVIRNLSSSLQPIPELCAISPEPKSIINYLSNRYSRIGSPKNGTMDNACTTYFCTISYHFTSIVDDTALTYEYIHLQTNTELDFKSAKLHTLHLGQPSVTILGIRQYCRIIIRIFNYARNTLHMTLYC